MSSRLRCSIAVELLVVGVGDGLEARFVLGRQHGRGIAPEVGARHGDDVGAGLARSAPTSLRPSTLSSVGRDVVELVDGDRAGRRTPPRPAPRPRSGTWRGYRPARRRAEARKAPTAFTLERATLRIVRAGRVAQVPLRLDMPVRLEAVARQRLGRRRRRRSSFSGTTMIACRTPWWRSLSSATNISARLLPRGGRRLDEQVLLAPPRIGAPLHGPHPQLVGR